MAEEFMLKHTIHKNPVFKFRKVSVGRMLIAVYVIVVLTLSATAKAQVSASCFENRMQISN